MITYEKLMEWMKDNPNVLEPGEDASSEKELIIEFQRGKAQGKEDLFILTPQCYEFKSREATLSINLSEYQTIESIDFI